jgi:hypothetical protein
MDGNRKYSTHFIFVSYTDADKDKVDLIVKEIKLSSNFEAIFIAEQREPLKALSMKVEEGLKKAEIFVPILTKNSITAQWLNQEIGFAKASGLKIMPIVESDQIDVLKGFIHKQIDLPYKYSPNSSKTKVRNDFLNQVRRLLSDLVEEFPDLEILPKLPQYLQIEGDNPRV